MRKHRRYTYRRRERVHGIDGSVPSVMSVGRLEGAIEDYDSYDKSHEEMKITNSYVDVSAKDCTVLSTIDMATTEDPFHYLGIKWLLIKFPVVRLRDWCYLEAMEINHDVQSERYGYLMLHSIKLKECPPFDRKAAIRGQMYFTFIFRESVHGMVEVYSRGLFDPAGEMIYQYSALATASVLTRIVSAVKCAEAKKLTLLALANGSPPPARIDSRVLCASSLRLSMHNCRVCRIDWCATCLVRAQNLEVRPAEGAFSILRRSSWHWSPSDDLHGLMDAYGSLPDAAVIKGTAKKSHCQDPGLTTKTPSGWPQRNRRPWTGEPLIVPGRSRKRCI